MPVLGETSPSLPGAMGGQDPTTAACTLPRWGQPRSGTGFCAAAKVRPRRDQGWIRPMQGRVGVEQPLLAVLQGLTQGSPSPVPIRGPRLTQVPPMGYFGSWQEI